MLPMADAVTAYRLLTDQKVSMDFDGNAMGELQDWLGWNFAGAGRVPTCVRRAIHCGAPGCCRRRKAPPRCWSTKIRRVPRWASSPSPHAADARRFARR